MDYQSIPDSLRTKWTCTHRSTNTFLSIDCKPTSLGCYMSPEDDAPHEDVMISASFAMRHVGDS